MNNTVNVTDSRTDDITFGTSTELQESNDVMPADHMIVETDDQVMKIGDGETLYNDLDVFYSMGLIKDLVKDISDLVSGVSTLQNLVENQSSEINGVKSSLENFKSEYETHKSNVNNRVDDVIGRVDSLEDSVTALAAKDIQPDIFKITIEAGASYERTLPSRFIGDNIMVDISSEREPGTYVPATAICRYEHVLATKKCIIYNDYPEAVNLWVKIINV